MKKKLISPALHGVLDYILGGTLMAVPSILKLEKPAIGNYQKLGINILAINALTNSGVGLSEKISLKDHKKADLTTLGGLAVAALSDTVRKNKKVFRFHLFVTAMVAANYVLTDYEGLNQIASDATHPEYQNV